MQPINERWSTLPDRHGSGTASSPSIADSKLWVLLRANRKCHLLEGPGWGFCKNINYSRGHESGAAACTETVMGIVTHNISGNTQWASSSFTSSLCSHGCSYQHQVHNILVYLFAVCHSAAFHSQVGLETWLMVKVLDFQNTFHQNLDLLNRAWVFWAAAAAGLRGRPWRIASQSFLCTPRNKLPGKLGEAVQAAGPWRQQHATQVSKHRHEVTEQIFIQDQNWNFCFAVFFPFLLLHDSSTTNCQQWVALSSYPREYSASETANLVNTIKLLLSLWTVRQSYRKRWLRWSRRKKEYPGAEGL